jgi:cyclomaltodextrinase / maltogenic alpha-amylase / neopullulanase
MKNFVKPISVIQMLVLASVLLVINGCNRSEKPLQHEPILHQAVWLDADTTRIWVSDFLPPGVECDSAVILQQRFIEPLQNSPIQFITPADAPVMFVMSLWSDGQRTDVPLKKSEIIKISYKFNPGKIRYKSVALKGEFNGWTPGRTPLVFMDSVWVGEISVQKGKYQYLIVADGKEMLDPGCPLTVDNNNGGFNSLLEVGEQRYYARPELFTQWFSKCKASIAMANRPENLLVFWNNTLLDTAQYKWSEDSLEIRIPKEAIHFKRSHLRVYAWNFYGFSNDLLIPLEKGKVFTDPGKLTRSDLHASIMYNVFVDRFFNGNPKNDKHLPDSIVLPKANYHGGDIPGVLQKLDEGYFDELNVNTLWLSPVVQNADGPYGQWNDPPTRFSAYHGYWPTSFTQIDTHFGTSEDLKMLVTRAHQAGLNILLDFVANHVHEDHPYYKANPDIATMLRLPDGTLNLERWDEHRLTTWFDMFLPSLDLERDDVAELVSDSTLWWVTEYQIDGFRHDAAKHIPLTFWRLLTKKLREKVVYPQNRPVFQMGETYGGVDLIGSYLGSGLLDAQFDFNVFDAALGTFAGGQPFGQLMHRLRESMGYYGSHNLMGYITGNQDRGRFISYAGGDLKFEENAKAAGWSREIGVGNPVGYDKLNMMMALIMTIPGVPVIYYGDEFGMAGGNDPDCRRMMRFGDQLNHFEQKNLAVTKRLAGIRASNMALLYGDAGFYETDERTLVIARTYFNNSVIVLFNNSDAPREIAIDVPWHAKGAEFVSNFGSEFNQTGVLLTTVLKPYSFEVLTMKQQ